MPPKIRLQSLSPMQRRLWPPKKAQYYSLLGGWRKQLKEEMEWLQGEVLCLMAEMSNAEEDMEWNLSEDETKNSAAGEELEQVKVYLESLEQLAIKDKITLKN